MAKLFIGEELHTGAYTMTQAPRKLFIRSPHFTGTVISFGMSIDLVADTEKNPEYVVTIDTSTEGDAMTFSVSSEYIVVYEPNEDSEAQPTLSILKGFETDFFGGINCPRTFVDNGDTFVVLNDSLPPKRIVDATSKKFYTNKDPRIHPIEVGSVYILSGFDKFMLYEVTHINPGTSTLDMIIQEPYPGNNPKFSRHVVSDEFLLPYYTDKIGYEKFLRSHYMTIENTCIVVDACSTGIRVWSNLTTDHEKISQISKIGLDITQKARMKGFNKFQLDDLTKAVLVKELDPDNLCRLEFVIFLFANDVVSIPIRFSKNSLIT